MLLSVEFSYQEDILHAPARFWTSETIASPCFVLLNKTAGAKSLAFRLTGGPADRRQARTALAGRRSAGIRRLPYSRSGIRHKSTKPTTNSTAMDSTPMDELPVSCVNTLTRNVPMTAAYLPKMSKKP